MLLMGLAINTVKGHGLSNEVRREFLSKKTKVANAVLAVHSTLNGI